MTHRRSIPVFLFLSFAAVWAGCTTSTSGAGGTSTTSGTGGTPTTSGSMTSGACLDYGEPCTSDEQCCDVANCFAGQCCSDQTSRGGCFCGDQDAGPPSDGSQLPYCDSLDAACNPDGGVPEDGGACMCVQVIYYTPCP